MDPDVVYKDWCRALLEEDTETAKEKYNSLRAWMERGGFEPVWSSIQRKQFFTFNSVTGMLG